MKSWKTILALGVLVLAAAFSAQAGEPGAMDRFSFDSRGAKIEVRFFERGVVMVEVRADGVESDMATHMTVPDGLAPAAITQNLADGTAASDAVQVRYSSQPFGLAFYSRDGKQLLRLADRGLSWSEDGISDLVEASNYHPDYWTTGESYYFWPTIPEQEPSYAYGDTTSGWFRGGVQLPQEGIGYYHFHGGDDPHSDNWAVLKMIKVMEQAGREWNQLHPEGPRIGIGDISMNFGGEMCWCSWWDMPEQHRPFY